MKYNLIPITNIDFHKMTSSKNKWLVAGKYKHPIKHKTLQSFTLFILKRGLNGEKHIIRTRKNNIRQYFIIELNNSTQNIGETHF